MGDSDEMGGRGVRVYPGMPTRRGELGRERFDDGTGVIFPTSRQGKQLMQSWIRLCMCWMDQIYVF